MGAELTYDQICKILLSSEIEEYVPDGISITHPVIDLRDGRLVDCFLLYSLSRDGKKYTVPTARIVIDAECEKLVEFKTSKEKPFSVYKGVDYFQVSDTEKYRATDRENELKYQEMYMRVRKIAFSESVPNSSKETLIQYIKLLKTVELSNLQPFLFELAMPFFKWYRGIIREA